MERLVGSSDDLEMEQTASKSRTTDETSLKGAL